MNRGGVRACVRGQVVICAMLVSALCARALPGRGTGTLAVLAAAAFVVSDAVLALNKFRAPFVGERARARRA